jgi:RNA polymerase sigma-B factor
MTARMVSRTICVVPRTLALVHSRSPRTGASPCSATSVAAETLVRSYLPLAGCLARRYANRGEPIEDLVQVANLGLVKAARRFDKDRGIGFSTYATHVINGELMRHFRDHAWTLYVPRRAKDRAVRVTTAIRRERERTGVDPSLTELARRLELSESDVADAHETWFAFRAESLDAPPQGHLDPDLPPLSDQLGAVDDEYERVNGRLTRLATMRGLSLLERRILHLRYVEERTQSEIAAEVGLSQNGVSRRLRRMLQQLDLAAA